MFIPKITIIQKFVDIICIQIGRKKSAVIFTFSISTLIFLMLVACGNPIAHVPLGGIDSCGRFLFCNRRLGLNTILFQKFFTYTCIIDIQQIDQDLIVSSWLIYFISWNIIYSKTDGLNIWDICHGSTQWLPTEKAEILTLKISKLINGRNKQKTDLTHLNMNK